MILEENGIIIVKSIHFAAQDRIGKLVKMEKFIAYIEQALPDRPGDTVLYQFKRQILDEMTARAAAVSARGLNDQKVLEDLILSEYPDLPGAYAAYSAKKASAKRAKRSLLFHVLGSVGFILLLLVVFLAVSFWTKAWGQTWVIMVDGILLWIDYLLFVGIKKLTSLRRLFQVFARVLLAIGVMVAAVAVFLFCMAVLHAPNSWLVVIGGIAAMFAADSLYIAVTRQKLAAIFYLAYIPAFFSMLYVIFGAAGLLPWSPGWVIIPLSLLLDVVVIAVLLIYNKKISREVARHWNED